MNDPCFLPALIYCRRAILSSGFCSAAGEMLQMAEPFLEHSLHPTVIIRGYVQALEDALSTIDSLAFPIDTGNKDQMLKIISSCIGTKFTSRFGTLMPVSTIFPTLSCTWSQKHSSNCFSVIKQWQHCHFYVDPLWLSQSRMNDWSCRNCHATDAASSHQHCTKQAP